MIQQALVMRDHQETATGGAQGIHPFGHQFHRIDIQAGIGFIQDAHLGFQHGHLQDFVALFLATRKAHVHRTLEHFGINFQAFGLFAHQFQKIARRDFRLAARFALRIQSGAQKGHVAHARNFDRILKGQEQALSGAHFWVHRQKIGPVQRGAAIGDGIAIAARQNVRQRRFARPIRPHNRVNLASPNRQRDALQDLLILFFQFHMQVLDFKHSSCP